MSENNRIQSIWETFKSGDKESFAYLYNLHVGTLFSYGTKLTQDENLVKDAIQEIFLDLYLKRETNNTDPENLKYYLILALKRNLIKKLKRNRKHLSENANGKLLFEPIYSIERTIIQQEDDLNLNRRISNLLNKLPAGQKEALYLRFYESLEYGEIAKLLSISIESVRKQVYRALKSIRESFVNEPFNS